MRIEDYINQRGITSLYHFTVVGNLESILKNGLLSRTRLNNNRIGYYYNDGLRLDNRLNTISISISFPNYRMFYSYRQRAVSHKWCVIELNPNILYEKNCLFCITNAANNSETTRSDKEKKGVMALEKLFYNNEYRQRLGLCSEMPTNPQAEVLVMDDIEPCYIKSINFDTEIVNFCINNYPQFTFLNNPRLFLPREDWRSWQ